MQLSGFEHSLVLLFLGIWIRIDLFQSCGHFWVFQICSHIGSSPLIASSFRILNSSAGSASPPLALLTSVLPKAHLTSHSRIRLIESVILGLRILCFNKPCRGFFYFFIFKGQLLYNAVLVSAIYQHESVIDYTYIPFLLNLPPTSRPIPPLRESEDKAELPVQTATSH